MTGYKISFKERFGFKTIILENELLRNGGVL